MLRSQLRGVKQRPDHLRHARPTEPSLRRTTASMRRSKPGASLVRRKRWQICSGPPCGCPHARTAPSPFSATAPPMGSDLGLTPSSASGRARSRLGISRFAPSRRGRVQFRGIKTPPAGVSPRGGRSDSYPDGLSTTPVLCRDRCPLTGGVGEYCGRCIGVAWKRSWGGRTETRRPRVITRESRRGVETWARRRRLATRARRSRADQ